MSDRLLDPAIPRRDPPVYASPHVGHEEQEAVGPATPEALTSEKVIPGSGERIEGVHLPLWEEVRAFAYGAMHHVLSNRSIGWDIAIAEDGPIIVGADRIWTPYPGNDLAPVLARIARR